MSTLMVIAFSLIVGIVAVVIALIFRHAAFVLFILAVWWTYSWLSADPVRDRNTVEVRQSEEQQIETQRAKVALTGVQVVFEKQGSREIHAMVVNGSRARISDISLRCSYERPDEDDPWRLTTPVAGTGVLQPGEQKRLTFWLRDAASDANPDTFDCEPVFYMDQSDLMRSNLLKPKTQDDRLLVSTDVRVSARLGKEKYDYVPIIASGSITNNSQTDIPRLDLSCSSVMNVYGRVETIFGGVSVYVTPGDSKLFDFVVGKMHVENPKFGIQDTSCQGLNVNN
jgi:hypothetical protein